MILINDTHDFEKTPIRTRVPVDLLTSRPTDLNVNNAVSGIDKMVFLVDPSIVNNITQIYVYMSQFLLHKDQAMI